MNRNGFVHLSTLVGSAGYALLVKPDGAGVAGELSFAVNHETGETPAAQMAEALLAGPFSRLIELLCSKSSCHVVVVSRFLVLSQNCGKPRKRRRICVWRSKGSKMVNPFGI